VVGRLAQRSVEQEEAGRIAESVGVIDLDTHE
jgi:hypothetical protein